MIAVPAHPVGDMQRHLIGKKQHGGNFVGDLFRRVKMPVIQQALDIIFCRIIHIKLVRADRIRLYSDTKELGLHAVDQITAVDLGGIKNIVGAFHQPRAVLIDPEVLKTLDARQFACGAAEIIKMAATFDEAFFARIEASGVRGSEAQIEEIIANALRIKAHVVEADEKEQGLRKALNFGHTLGHGMESVSGNLLHGECVALGMLPMTEPALRDRLRQVLQREGLPTACREDATAVCRAAMHDKKADGGAVTTIRVRRIGSFYTEPADEARLKQDYEEVFG